MYYISHIKNPEEKPPKWNKTHDLSALLFFRPTGGQEHEEVSFCFVPFCFNTFAGFVLGFHTSQNVGTRMGDRFSLSVPWDQMLVAWGNWAPLEHSFGLWLWLLLLWWWWWWWPWWWRWRLWWRWRWWQFKTPECQVLVTKYCACKRNQYYLKIYEFTRGNKIA